MKIKTTKFASKKWWLKLYAAFFFVLVLFVIKQIAFEYFIIPTSSMEGSLLRGDKIVCNKLPFGIMIPHKRQDHNIKKASLNFTDFLPERLPKLREVKPNEIIIFHYPIDSTEKIEDKTCYIKRCVGVAGDWIRIARQDIFRNEKWLPNSPDIQLSYTVRTKEKPETMFHHTDVKTWSRVEGKENTYLLYTTPKQANVLRQDLRIEEINPRFYERNDTSDASVNENGRKLGWNRDYFGSYYIPKRGDALVMHEGNLLLYETIIKRFEGNQNVEIKDKKLYIEGKLVEKYTFKQNYYFVLGDNRHNSSDSRMWGLVPEDHLIGTPLLIYHSETPADGIKNWARVRWERFFKWVN